MRFIILLIEDTIVQSIGREGVFVLARVRNLCFRLIDERLGVSQLSSPLKCLMARTIAAEESVTGD
jgi:hypothetical protein